MTSRFIRFYTEPRSKRGASLILWSDLSWPRPIRNQHRSTQPDHRLMIPRAEALAGGVAVRLGKAVDSLAFDTALESGYGERTSRCCSHRRRARNASLTPTPAVVDVSDEDGAATKLDHLGSPSLSSHTVRSPPSDAS